MFTNPSLVLIAVHPPPTWIGGSVSGKSSGDSLRSLGTGTESERRRKGKGGLLGVVKKGVGAVWEKVTADHPEPLPVDKVRIVVTCYPYNPSEITAAFRGPTYLTLRAGILLRWLLNG